MGQLVSTVVGGAIGFAIGGPLGASIGMSIGGMVGGMLFAPTIEGPRLNDLKVTTSTYGSAIPELYGTMRVGTNLIWTSGIKETKHTQRAGKGGPKQTTYTYSASFALAVCKGPIDSVLRVWGDGKLIYDRSSSATRSRSTTGSGVNMVEIWQALLTKNGKHGSGSSKFTMRVYQGTDTQLPDSLIEADKGVGNVSAHRGMCYIVFENFQLADFGNRIPQITVEVTRTLTNNIPALTLKDSTGAVSTLGGNFVIDWELSRAYRNVTGGCDVIDIDTMKVLYTVPNVYVGAASRNNYIQGMGLAFSETGSGNSRPWLMFDMLSGSQVGTYGNSGGFSGTVLSSGDYGYPTYTFGGGGQLGYGYVTSPMGGRTVRMLSVGTFLDTFGFKPGVYPPIFATNAPWGVNNFIPGRDDGLTAEIIGWRASGGGVQFQIWHIPAGAEGKLEDVPAVPPGPYHYIPDTNWTVTTPTVNPFAVPFSPTAVLYDPTDDTLFVIGALWILNQGAAFKWSPRTNQVKWQSIISTTNVPSPEGMAQSRIAGGTFSWLGQPPTGGFGHIVWSIDLQTGAVSHYDYGSFTGLGDQVYLAPYAWDDVTSSMIVTSSWGYRFRIFLRNGGSSEGLRAVVTDICERTRLLTADDIDVTGLTDAPVFGYLIDRETTARDVFKQLATAYLFDGYESDYKIKFRTRGTSSMVNIPEDWIGRNDSGTVKETTTQELELPMKVSVKYYDCSIDYGQGVQSQKRNASPIPTMLTAKEDSVELPLAWYPIDAKQCADKLLKATWANRVTYEFTLPWKYLKYDPTDTATVTRNNGTVFTMRFNEVTMGADFTSMVKAAAEKAAAYSSVAVPSNPAGIPDQIIPYDYPSKPFVVNTPLLRDTDYDPSNNAMIYITAGALSNQFAGAYIYQSFTGLEFTSLGFVAGSAITGLCLNALPNTTAWESTDETFVLKVRLNNASALLESVTQTEMVDGLMNGAIVGNEVIQFRDAVQQSDGTWWLTGLLRARRGTNYAIPYHTVGETFILLDAASFITTTRAPSDYITTHLYKAVSPSGAESSALSYSYSLTPRDLQPWSPEAVALVDDGTTCTLTAQRRSRVISPLMDYTGTIHYKETDKLSARIAYEVWINKTLADEPILQAAADITGSVNLFDSSGNEIPISITFPKGGNTRFLVKIYEVGVVDGIPKWIQFDRTATSVPWEATILY